MGFDLRIFEDHQLEADYIEWLVDERSIDIQTHFTKLWEYYTNRMYETNGSGASALAGVNESGRGYLQA